MGNIKKIKYTSIETEHKLESIIAKDISILKEDYLLLGRQINTSYGKIIDLLTINEEGKITIIH